MGRLGEALGRFEKAAVMRVTSVGGPSALYSIISVRGARGNQEEQLGKPGVARGSQEQTCEIRGPQDRPGARKMQD